MTTTTSTICSTTGCTNPAATTAPEPFTFTELICTVCYGELEEIRDHPVSGS
ncbi:hypothetical protein [Nocardia yamanashiensis]|uniref:hypothetical protein n=1 Tax=Nocardia yamanashiensis TaxID=209247 RepID=UPI000B20DA8E|nr:hypothetical protein [Nocardia yamanashiensis]